jgi:hypothetical protein
MLEAEEVGWWNATNRHVQQAHPTPERRQPSPVYHGTSATELPEKAITVDEQSAAAAAYTYTYTTGPIALPSNTQSLDWAVLNDDSTIQTIRVTVFKCNLGAKKTVEPPGPLEVTLDPGECTHNANAALGGFLYEIQVKCNSQRVFPYASAWPGNIGDPLPGSVVKTAEFIRRLS